MIGPAHYVRFRGLAIPTVGIFQTPIGPVALDRDALTAIATTASVRLADSHSSRAPETLTISCHMGRSL